MSLYSKYDYTQTIRNSQYIYNIAGLLSSQYIGHKLTPKLTISGLGLFVPARCVLHQQTREISAMALQGLARPTLTSKDPRSGDHSGIHWSFLTRAAESQQGITGLDSLTDPADRGKDKVSGSPFWLVLERSGKILSKMANA
jgi:hypothetical protein